MNPSPAILQSRRAANARRRSDTALDPAPAGADAAADEDAGTADCDALWSICVAIAGRRREGLPPCPFAVGGHGDAVGLDSAAMDDDSVAGLGWEPGRGWYLHGTWSGAARAMFLLYRPLLELAPGQRYVIGHLGQSIDGRIATSSGDSCFINGKQNLVHMHRLRALCDAVLVGSGTVLADDPQLTTRLVPGPDATRVVLDPSRRLTASHRIFSDERCPTLLARYPQAVPEQCGIAEIIPARRADQGIDLAGLLDSLADRRLHAILVEGGGITVSRFLEHRLLDRLQIAIAPVIIGSGRHGLQLPEVLVLSDCLRPSCRQHLMGEDVLWDLDMREGREPAPGSTSG